MSSCSTCIHQMGNIPFWFYLSVHVLTLIGVWKNAEKRNLIFCTRYYGQPVRARAPRPAYLSAAPSVSGKSQGTNYFQDPTKVARTTARHHAAGVATAHPQEKDAPRVKTPGSARPVRREFRNGARAGTGAEDQKWSFALSSSGWLFVYYIGVVKALAARGFHR